MSGAVEAQIILAREVLAEQTVGVLIAAALPWAVGVAEVDHHVRVRAEPYVVSHLFALVPGQRPARLGRKLGNLSRQRGTEVLGGVAVRQVEKDDIAARALHQPPDCRTTSLPDDQIAFPVPRNSAIVDLRRAIADQDHVLEPAGTGLLRAHVGPSLRPSRPEAGRELLAQRAARLDEQRLIDRLVRNAHGQVVRIVTDQPRGDLLRRPVGAQPPLDFTAQPRVDSKLRWLGSLAPLDRLAVGTPGAIAIAGSAPRNLARDRRGGPPQA